MSTVYILNKERVEGRDDLIRDRYGTVYKLSDLGEPLPVDCPVAEPKDAGKVAGMQPDPAEFVMLRYLVAKMGKDVAHFFAIPGPFRFSWQLRGAMEKLLLDYMRNPDLVLELARTTTDFCTAAIEMAPEETSTLQDWLERRRAHVASCRSELSVGHLDLLGWIPS